MESIKEKVAVIGMGCTHLAGSLKLHGIPMTRVDNWCTIGHEALRNACFGGAYGMYDLVLVLGVEKLKDTGFPALGAGWGMSPVLEARRTAPGSFGMIATRYFYSYGLTPHEGKRIIGKTAVKNHYNGSLCPRAQSPERPLKDVRLGISQTFGGPPQVAAVAVLGKDLGYP